MKILFLSLFLVSCGRYNMTILENMSDPELIPYAELYRDVINDPPTQVYMKFRTLEDPVVGRCYFNYKTKARRIVIDPEYWFKNPKNREQLMFHEFGHCFHRLKHDDTRLPDGKRRSLMASKLIPSWIYKENQEYYRNELKEKVQATIKW
jgi:hypothetical protein